MGADEEGTLDRLKGRRQLIDPKMTEHRGRIVKTTADGRLVEFASVVDAVRCAAEFQRAMVDRDCELAEDRRVLLRVGIARPVRTYAMSAAAVATTPARCRRSVAGLRPGAGNLAKPARRREGQRQSRRRGCRSSSCRLRTCGAIRSRTISSTSSPTM